MTKQQAENWLCPTCRQDLRDPPQDGNSRKDCPQCGQGMSKTTAHRVRARLAKLRGKK